MNIIGCIKPWLALLATNTLLPSVVLLLSRKRIHKAEISGCNLQDLDKGLLVRSTSDEVENNAHSLTSSNENLIKSTIIERILVFACIFFFVSSNLSSGFYFFFFVCL